MYVGFTPSLGIKRLFPLSGSMWRVDVRRFYSQFRDKWGLSRVGVGGREVVLTMWFCRGQADVHRFYS